MKLARWNFSIALLVGYLLVFHSWNNAGRSWIMASGLVVGGCFLIALLIGARTNYFVNGWDAAFHLSVVADIFIESILVEVHRGFSFYLCALAFAILIVGYRFYLRHKHTAPSVADPTPRT